MGVTAEHPPATAQQHRDPNLERTLVFLVWTYGLDVWLQVADLVQIQTLTDRSCRLAWHVFGRLHQDGEMPSDDLSDVWLPAAGRTDAGGAVHTLEGTSVLEAMGGLSGIADVVSGYRTRSDHARRIAEDLAELHRRRQLTRRIERAWSEAQKPEADPQAIIDGLVVAQREIYEQADGVDLSEVERSVSQDKRCGSWGIERLDRMVPVIPGQYTLLGGTPGCGKTTLAIQMIAASVQRLGNPVYFISTDQNEKEIREKLEQHSSVQWKDIAPKVRAHYAPQTATKLLATMERAQANGYQIIVVDFLQDVEPEKGVDRNQWEGINRASRGIKRLVRQYGITAIVLSQYTEPKQADGKWKARMPTLESIRGGSQMGQDCDNAVLLYKREEHCGEDGHQQIGANMPKVRRAKTAAMRLLLKGAESKIMDPRGDSDLPPDPLAEDQTFWNVNEPDPPPF